MERLKEDDVFGNKMKCLHPQYGQIHHTVQPFFLSVPILFFLTFSLAVSFSLLAVGGSAVIGLIVLLQIPPYFVWPLIYLPFN